MNSSNENNNENKNKQELIATIFKKYNLENQIAEVLHQNPKINLDLDIEQDQLIFNVFKNEEIPQDLQLFISFLTDQKYHRKTPSKAKELISKACGWGLGFRNLLDLTAGLGGDAVFLSQVGFRVQSLERNPILFILLDQALQKARTQEPNSTVWNNVSFKYASAYEELTLLKTQMSENRENTNNIEFPEVIYYDPMYPHTSKSALPTKEMQILRFLIGKDEADIDILKLAIRVTQKIVVVKRPLHAPEILAKPNRVYKGKQIRFDVYTANLNVK